MQIGDLVQSLQRNWRRVVAITPVANQETVYNFTVDLNHDNFVGDVGFLVHNAGGCGCGPQNPLEGLPWVGSALKNNLYHGFPALLDQFAAFATPTTLPSGATLYQIPGSLNGMDGRYEWITDKGNLTHRFFCKGGSINGIPIVP